METTIYYGMGQTWAPPNIGWLIHVNTCRLLNLWSSSFISPRGTSYDPSCMELRDDQWIGGKKLQETTWFLHVFTIKYMVVSCKFSLKPWRFEMNTSHQVMLQLCESSRKSTKNLQKIPSHHRSFLIKKQPGMHVKISNLSGGEKARLAIVVPSAVGP